MTTQTTPPLERLRAELDGRGWTTQLDQGVLHVANPTVARLDDKVIFDGDMFRWEWAPPGQCIGPATDVVAAADHIVHVLRDPDTSIT